MGIFSNNVIKEIGVGEWDFSWHFTVKDLKKSYLEVKSTTDQFVIRIPANTDTYGYLLEAANQEMYSQLQNWITEVYAVMTLTVTDQALDNDICRAIIKWQKRMMKKGEREAKSVTKTQIQADEAFMGDVIAESEMNKEELAKKRAEDKEILKQILTEKE